MKYLFIDIETTKSHNDVFWRILLQKDSVIGKIVYGRV